MALPEEAVGEVRRAAERFVVGGGDDVQALWSTFHGSLHDLCRDEPLDGDFLSLFEALEAWEAGLPGQREDEVHRLREAAARVASR